MDAREHITEPKLANGCERVIEGVSRLYYDGYWIKSYPVPTDTLGAKRQLIEALTRRLFNHVEHGINIPGIRLDEARRAFETEVDPDRRRVKAAMLAGALFNRVTDIFTKLVEMETLGVRIQPEDALLRRCGDHLQEALKLGKMVLHRSGEEGIDELWGEPFKAFAFPIDAFYKSRYVKIAQAMRAIDTVADALCVTFSGLPLFEGVQPLVRAFAASARLKTETLRTEGDIFEVWTSFVVSSERLADFSPRLSSEPTVLEERWAFDGMVLLRQGKDLISDMARARVAMPKSTGEFLERLAWFRSACDPVASERVAGGARRRRPSPAVVARIVRSSGRPRG